MTITNTETGTSIHEIAHNIFRVSTPIPASAELPLGFSFNQFLIAAEEPLLFHTGPRKLFPLVREAISSVLPPETLRYVGFSHVEGDESGALTEWLALAPRALPVCSQVAAMIFTRRRQRSARASTRPRRKHRARGPSRDLVRRAARPAWLGMRLPR